MKVAKITHWIFTILVSMLMLMSAGMYLASYDAMSHIFEKLGYPSYLIIPLAIAKLLAVVAITTKKSKVLMEWAYAGLFFNFVLAAGAHLAAADGQFIMPLVAIALLLISRATVPYAFAKGKKREAAPQAATA